MRKVVWRCFDIVSVPVIFVCLILLFFGTIGEAIADCIIDRLERLKSYEAQKTQTAKTSQEV